MADSDAGFGRIFLKVRIRGRGFLVLGAMAFALCVAGPASASTWKVSNVPAGPVGGILWAVSCPSTSLCVATGTNSTIATTTNPTGGAAAWQSVHPEGYWLPPIGDPGNTTYPGNAIRGVSCPTNGFCAAIGHQGHFFATTYPTGPAEAWVEAPLGLDATHMNGISCPTTSLCVAAGQNGRIVTSTDPTGGAGAWQITKLNEPFDLRGVSCPTTSLCVAVGLEGNILSSTNPTGGAGAWDVARQPAGEKPLHGVSCPSPSLCVTGNPGQMLTSTSPAGGASTWRPVAAGSGLPVTAASCPGEGACAAVTNNADVITSTDPTGGPSAWSFKNVIPHLMLPSGKENPKGDTNAIWGISCPTAALCVGVGQERKVIYSTDPFAEDPIKKGLPKGSRPRRPHAVITHHPGKRVERRRGGAKVTFRFRSVGRAIRFRCRLNKRKLTTCKSPKRYRLKQGRYHFKVFAVGPGGVRGPAARYRFRVGPLLEPGPQKSCEPGKGQSAPHPHGVRGCQEPPTRTLLAGRTTRAPLAGQVLVVTHPAPGMGVVTSDPPGLVCETFFCGAEFAQGSVVRLIATPRKGFAFAGYTDACSGPDCTVTMDAERRVTVTFFRFGELPRKKPQQVTADGSAVLTVRVGGPGRVVLTGRDVTRQVSEPAVATNVKLPVVARGRVAERLKDGGRARVKVRVAFTPEDGTRAVLTRTLKLKRVIRVLGPRRQG